MTTKQLSQRLRRLSEIWESKNFTLGDVWDYLDLVHTDFKLKLEDWGHRVWIIPVGASEYEVDVYFNDFYKELFKKLDDYEDEILFEIEFSQQIENIFIEKLS